MNFHHNLSKRTKEVQKRGRGKEVHHRRSLSCHRLLINCFSSGVHEHNGCFNEGDAYGVGVVLLELGMDFYISWQISALHYHPTSSRGGTSGWSPSGKSGSSI
nr:hypothetical protein CFP56_28091 [Quercus suber]